MENKKYGDGVESFLTQCVVPAGYTVTKPVELDPVPESSKYEALSFSLDGKIIVHRQGKVTPDRPGAFLTVWQRPVLSSTNNKPIPLESEDLDYLFVQVKECRSTTANGEPIAAAKHGVFIFPLSILIEKGIVPSTKSKGKTGFRVFPPWSQDRGELGTKVFSASGKKTQRWQLPYFLEIDKDGLIDPCELNKVLRTPAEAGE